MNHELYDYPPASEASMGGSKFNWKKQIHIPPYMLPYASFG